MQDTIYKLTINNKSKYLYKYSPQLFLFSEHPLSKIIPIYIYISFELLYVFKWSPSNQRSELLITINFTLSTQSFFFLF